MGALPSISIQMARIKMLKLILKYYKIAGIGAYRDP